MKTAVSLPDDLFEMVDELAERTGRSRSQVYADALREYVARHDDERITAALDQLAAEVDTRVEPAQTRATRRLLTRESW